MSLHHYILILAFSSLLLKLFSSQGKPARV
jgi:hypothetical protein